MLAHEMVSWFVDQKAGQGSASAGARGPCLVSVRVISGSESLLSATRHVTSPLVSHALPRTCRGLALCQKEGWHCVRLMQATLAGNGAKDAFSLATARLPCRRTAMQAHREL